VNKSGSNINSKENTLNNINCQSPLGQNNNIDPPPGYCNQDELNQNNVGNGKESWISDSQNQKTNLGKENNCDPMQTGQIINDLDSTNRNNIYRYAKSLRGTDEAVMDLFRNIVVLDESGKAHPIPIMWGTQERAVAFLLQENTRKDNTLVVDRIKLPLMAIHNSGYEFDQSRYTYHAAVDFIRDKSGKPSFYGSEKYKNDTVFGQTRGIPINISYTLSAWTLYVEDINQILEQIFLKFSPVSYIKVRGVNWEVLVKLDSIANNLNYEPGDAALRVIKYEFSMTAKTYIAQPLVRKKTVLETRIEMVDGLKEEDITEVIGRIEESVKELNK
jgi:hypothetical protein